MARPVIVRVGSAQKLYYSPRQNGTDLPVMYSYDGTTSTLVWTAPDESGPLWQPTFLYPYNGTILIFCADYYWTEQLRVYQYSPGTGTATKVVDDYVAGSAFNPARQVATRDGLLYVHHGGRNNSTGQGPVICSLDPATWTLTTLQTAYTVGTKDDGAGGVAVSDDGNIYWCTGRLVYSSATGEADSWSSIYDCGATGDERNVTGWGAWSYVCGLYYNATDGRTYFGGEYQTGSTQAWQRVRYLRDNSVTVDSEVDIGAVEERQYIAFVQLPGGIAALEGGKNPGIAPNGTWASTYNTGSGWDADLEFIGVEYWGMSPGGATKFQNKLYFGLGYEILRRNDDGSTTVIDTYTGDLNTGWGWFEDCPMAVL